MAPAAPGAPAASTRREPAAPAAEAPQPGWTVPPLEDLQRLHGLARTGDMRKIREQAQGLEQADPRFAAFAQHLRDLALQFRSQAVSEFIAFSVARLEQGQASDTETAELDKR
jgi:hypothetical protein